MENLESIEQQTCPRILVVDDNADNLFTYDTTLSSLDYELVKVSSGKEALRQLLNTEFALILLDVVMPEMNGFETAKLIRSRKKTSAVPIIFVTAYRDDEIRMSDGYALGAVDYIFTPIDPEVLKAKVTAFVNLYNFSKSHEILLQKELSLAKERKEHEGQLAEAARLAEILRREKELERKSAELNAARAENLTRYNAELRQFAYVASHDLQEPLRVVTNYLQLLDAQYGKQLDAAGKEYIDIVLSSAKRMKQLIFDLLAYSRVTYQDGFNPSKVDCNAVVAEVLKTLALKVEETKAEITIDSLPHVMSDAVLVSQLFQNLLSNALKFQSKELPKIKITCAQTDDGMGIFCIEDNGIGIDPKYFDKVFTIFQRLHTREAFPGTGIGLAICKKIVERSGGKIWLESEVGKGTRFFFSFPLPSHKSLPVSTSESASPEEQQPEALC